MPDLDRLIQAIDAAEQSSYGSDSDSDLQTDRALAIDYYHGRNVEPAPDGRSQVVDRTVFETIQWILPSLCRIFANGDDIVQLQPFGPEDEEPAKQESDYLNYIVTQKNPWFRIFLTWAHDALLSKNGYCLAYMEEKLQTETESYERQSDESLALLLKDEGTEVVEYEAVQDDTQQVPVTNELGQPVVDPQTGQPAMQPRVLHTVTIRRTQPIKKLCFKVLPPERTKVDINTNSFTLEDCDYFEYWDIVTLSHLRSLGFDVEDELASGQSDSDDSQESAARNLYSEDSLDEHTGEVDPSMKRVKARMIWIRHDYDDDGIAELQQCYRVGSTILKRDGKPAIYQCTRIPVASVTPNINPHRHVGTSEADLSADIQRIRTAMMRGGLDGFNLAINPRHIVSNEINLDDMLVSRPGGIVRTVENSSAIPGEGHVLPIVTQNTLPDAIAGLEYMSTVNEGRTGVSRAFAGVNPDALTSNRSSGNAINQLSTMAAQRVEQIARIFASGIEYLFSVAHELIIKSGHQSEVVKLRGKWTPIDPSTWKTGRDMRIVVGYGAGNKDALVARLMMIANVQKEAMLGGLTIVTPQNVYETAVELTKASDFTAPQRFFTDPSTVEPPPKQPSEAEIYAGVEQAKLQSAQQVKAAELQSEERIKAAELDQNERLAQLDAELKIVLEQMKLGGNVDLERLRGAIKNEPIEKGNQKIDALSKTQTEQAQRTEALAQSLIETITGLEKRLTEAAHAPREVVRGQDGRVAGVKIGGLERKVKRDASGRVSGLQ